MIVLPTARGRHYGVVGLGKSGRATVASLLASGAHITAWDDGVAGRNAAQQEFPDLNIAALADWDFSGLQSLVMSPGILPSHGAVDRAKKSGVEVIGDIELLYRAQPEANYIAITGTNGKSTTTSLIGHILQACGKQAAVGGNLGIPALALGPSPCYVLELSSYQLELVTGARFQTAILLNITPDHLDHHGSMEHYIDAKRRIFDRQRDGDVAIIGVDGGVTEAIACRMLSERRQQIVPVTVMQAAGSGVEVEGGILRARAFGGDGADLAPMRALQGQHNWQNAAAAYAACRVNGCAHRDIVAAMHSYPGLPHRMQWLGEINGVTFVNDSKATNADAAEKALKTYDDIYWIAGGVAKEGGIEPLAPYFPKIRHAYLIGEAADDFAHTLQGRVNYTQCGSLEKAFECAASAASAAPEHASTRSVVLAPACASFDQFANFEVRGDAFMALVEQWRKQ